MKGKKYSAREKRKALAMWLDEKKDVELVAYKFKCTIQSLYRWRRAYNGTLESLQNKSSRPHTPHPMSHTDAEREHIVELLHERPDISYAEALGELRARYGYSRTYFGFYRFVVKNGLRPTEERERYIAKPYDTPEMFGVKMQMDVKYVPRECYKGVTLPDEKRTRFFQYTMIDEATRERFIYPYTEQSARATRDFIKRAIVFFGYIPACIQTDNGGEFTNPRGAGCKKIHIADEIMNKLKIKHQLIRAYTPRHNGKVERSHRSDNEGFYRTLTFTDYDELKVKMQDWCNRYNNRPHSSLRDRNGKRRWQTPLQKRAELLEMLKAGDIEGNIRFIKKRAA